jgi:glycosyltransferase involved in cell wall biosynthesis
MAVPEKRSHSDSARAISLAITMQDLAGGGVERQTLALAGELLARGLQVTLVVNQARGELRAAVPAGIPLIDLHCRRTAQAIPRLARFLRRERPDLLLSNLNHNSIAAVLANILAGMPAKAVICQHSVLSAAYLRSKGWSHRVTPFAYRLLSPGFARAVAVSSGIAQEFRSIAHIPRRKIAVIHNPVIGPDFALRAGQEVRHPWFGDATAPLFVTAGRLVETKDHSTLLRAFALYRRHHNGRLLILGAGPLRDSLGALAGGLGLDGAVDFLGFQENPLPYVQAADAFVLSSSAEGFGNVLVEAMGCGTPVISTNCEHGPGEILDDGRYGLLVPPRDPQALADAMARVAGLRDRFPAALLQSRAAAFTTAACADSYLRLLQSLLPMPLPLQVPPPRREPPPNVHFQSGSV